MLNHIILTAIVALLALVIHHWVRRAGKREPLELDIERWEDDGGPSSARSN